MTRCLQSNAFTWGYLALGLLWLTGGWVLAASPVLEAAADLLRRGDNAGAAAVYQAALQQNPTSLEARLGLAAVANRRGNYLEVRRHLEAALRQHPQDPTALAALGRLLHRWGMTLGKPQPALVAHAGELLHQAQALAPADPLVLAYLADWQRDRGDVLAAEGLLTQAQHLDPTLVTIYQGWTRLHLHNKDLLQARENALHALELAPENPETFFLLAQVFAAMAYPEQAVNYARKAQGMDFGQPLARELLLAQELEKLGSLAEALGHYQTVHRQAPGQVPILLRLAGLSERLNQPAASIAYYQQAMALDASLLPRWIREAQQLTRQEQVPLGLAAWRHLLALSPGNPEALHGLATLHYLAFFQKLPTDPQLAADFGYFPDALSPTEEPLLALDRLKLEIARAQGITPTLQQGLQELRQSRHPLAAGEACFLLVDYPCAQSRLDTVDGETVEGYLLAADRLALMQELLASQILYQRGAELEPLPAIQAGLQRIAAQRKLAETRIETGNQRFDAKDYAAAVAVYREAQHLFPQWEVPALRLGDTYERLRDKAQAYTAYRQAVLLSPALLESKAFAKKYRKLERTAQRAR